MPEPQLQLINTEAQMWIKPHVTRYLRIIDEIKQYQETGVWPLGQPKTEDLGDELVKMLEGQSK